MRFYIFTYSCKAIIIRQILAAFLAVFYSELFLCQTFLLSNNHFISLSKMFLVISLLRTLSLFSRHCVRKKLTSVWGTLCVEKSKTQVNECVSPHLYICIYIYMRSVLNISSHLGYLENWVVGLEITEWSLLLLFEGKLSHGVTQFTVRCHWVSLSVQP